MMLIVRDEVARYRIEVPDCCELKLDHGGTDYLLVPDPDGEATPYWLFDDLLIEAARNGEFGLRLISESPLN